MVYNGGYIGTILHIDVTSGKATKRPLPPEWARDYLGGRGIGARIVYESVPPKLDAFDPSNPVVFSAPPLVGTGVPEAARLTISAKSPITGILGDSNSGGWFATAMKNAGYDEIVLQGCADKPTYIWIDDDRVELRDASRLWGLTVEATGRAIVDDLGDKNVHVACIGPAGENLVKYACTVTDPQIAHHVAGRTGTGAVLGSKKIKAIAVRGSGDVKLAHPEKFWEALNEYKEACREDAVHVGIRTKYGTSRTFQMRQKLGELQARNNTMGVWDRADKIDGEALQKYVGRAGGCMACFTTRCHRYFTTVVDGVFKCVAHGPQYTGLQSVGSNILVDDIEAVIHLNHLCNNYGLDVAAAGATLAYAMECYEKGILTKEDTDGLDLKWGDATAAKEMLRKIAYREGFGNILAEGTRRAAQIIGKGSEYYALEIKGAELDSGDPRGSLGRALGYSTSTRGADHLRAFPDLYLYLTAEEAELLGWGREALDPTTPKGKGKMVLWTENLMAIPDAMGTCKNSTFRSTAGFDNLIWKGLRLSRKFYYATTGIDLPEEELLRAGERITNLERCFAVREGVDRSSDRPPARFFQESLPEGPKKGAVLNEDDFNGALDEYYEGRGWDLETGIPTRKKLEQLNLKFAADDLHSLGKLPSRDPPRLSDVGTNWKTSRNPIDGVPEVQGSAGGIQRTPTPADAPD